MSLQKLYAGLPSFVRACYCFLCPGDSGLQAALEKAEQQVKQVRPTCPPFPAQSKETECEVTLLPLAAGEGEERAAGSGREAALSHRPPDRKRARGRRAPQGSLECH